jgi:fidgetin-like protein 1
MVSNFSAQAGHTNFSPLRLPGYFRPLVFIDEIDSLLSSRSSYGECSEMRKVNTEFFVQWGELQRAAAGKKQTDKKEEGGRVLVLAAANLPWEIDETARRRFVRRQYIPLPEDGARLVQFTNLLPESSAPPRTHLDEQDIQKLVDLTEGNVILFS